MVSFTRQSVMASLRTICVSSRAIDRGTELAWRSLSLGEAEFPAALVNAFEVGGHNVSLVLTRA